MEPCYIIAYSIEGPCGVNVNSVKSVEDKPLGRCQLNFQNGSNVVLDESCEAYNLKVPKCKPDKPKDMPVYG